MTGDDVNHPPLVVMLTAFPAASMTSSFVVSPDEASA